MQNYKRIIIDLQKEFDEDQELLDLLQPQKKISQNEQMKTGIKALFELKQSRIDMIPEEDEEKLKQDQRIMNNKDADKNKKVFNTGNGNCNSHIVPNICYHRKKQFDLFTNNQDNTNNNYSSNYNSIKNHHQMQQQLSSNNDTNHKLNSENERKDKGGLLSPPSRIDCNGCIITNEKNNESPSTSGITHDSMKKNSNIYHLISDIVNYNSNNLESKSIKQSQYGYLTQNIDLMKTQLIPPPTSLPPKKSVRPLSNPHLSNLNLKKEDNLICNQNIQGIINDLMSKREFSQNDKKRTQLGSAPSQSNNLKEKLFKYSYKSKDYFSNSNMNINYLRQLHKIKIERGLVSSKLIEKFSKQLSYDYANDFGKNKLNSHKHNNNNEPIKIIKM